MTNRSEPEDRWWERSRSYIRAYEDLEFLRQDELRPVRLQLELLKPELTLQKHRIRSTIVVFGGTRIWEKPDAERRLADLDAQLKKNPGDPRLQILRKAAERLLSLSRFYDEARKFGRIVSEANRSDGSADYVIVTGGGPGIMEAANRGAYDVGAESIGFNITLPHEQRPNQYITPDLCFQFRYFAIRKMHFLLRAKALVAFPGGYGTMDELFEALTLVQTQKVPPLPVVLMGREFWNDVLNFDALVENGVIDPEDKDLFIYAETAQEAWDYIREFRANHT
ncbi:MAG TPA: LOG family protein [bacterium]|nr:LOG family protein [bacterium]